MRADRVALGVARRQHGAITTAQLRAAGLTDEAIRHRVERGWLRRVHRGVYLCGALETQWSRAMAAVLAYGEGALLSHHPAAVLCGLHRGPVQAIHVTVAGRDVRDRDGIHAHSTSYLDPADATRRDGIPVTSPARVLLDIATTVTHTELERATNEARITGLVADQSLNEQFSRYPRHRGAAALKEVIHIEPRLTRSEAERRLLHLIRAARLLEPRTNARAGRYEVDFLWPEHRLVVEVDGYAFHSSRSAFERDRRRDAELGAMGYRVIRITWRQIVEEPEATIAILAAALAAQPLPSDLARSSTVSA
jgi:very-short-patch-repair endonuclease